MRACSPWEQGRRRPTRRASTGKTARGSWSAVSPAPVSARLSPAPARHRRHDAHRRRSLHNDSGLTTPSTATPPSARGTDLLDNRPARSPRPHRHLPPHRPVRPSIADHLHEAQRRAGGQRRRAKRGERGGTGRRARSMPCVQHTTYSSVRYDRASTPRGPNDTVSVAATTPPNQRRKLFLICN